MLTINRLTHYPQANPLSNHCTVVWVTRPERQKGAKDEVKQAEGPKAGPKGRKLEVDFY